jgi:uncharacterized membrane protein
MKSLLSPIIMCLGCILMAIIFCVPFAENFTVLGIQFDDALFIEGILASVLLFLFGCMLDAVNDIILSERQEHERRIRRNSAIYGIIACVGGIIFLTILNSKQ